MEAPEAIVLGGGAVAGGGVSKEASHMRLLAQIPDGAKSGLFGITVQLHRG